MVIYGTNFGAATGTVDLCGGLTGACGSPGATVQQIQYWGNSSPGVWQVNALVSASSSVNGPNIWVQLSQFGFAGLLLQSVRAAVPVVAVSTFNITSVAFTNS